MFNGFKEKDMVASGIEAAGVNEKKLFQAPNTFHTPLRPDLKKPFLPVNHNDTILVQKARYVDVDDIKALLPKAEKVKDAIVAKEMLAGSANQFGQRDSFFLYKIPAKETVPPEYQILYAQGEEPKDWDVVFNPEYASHPESPSSKVKEFSLGLPKGTYVEMDRYTKIYAKWIDSKGELQEKILEGFEAIIFQNKTDYLHGLPIERYYQPPEAEFEAHAASLDSMEYDEDAVVPPKTVRRSLMGDFDEDGDNMMES